MGKTKHLKIRSDWVVSNENEYSISTMTSRFLFKSRVSWIESLNFESNQYQIAWYLNRIAQCLNRIFVAILIAIESNRYLISPITDIVTALLLHSEFVFADVWYELFCFDFRGLIILHFYYQQFLYLVTAISV